MSTHSTTSVRIREEDRERIERLKLVESEAIYDTIGRALDALEEKEGSA